MSVDRVFGCRSPNSKGVGYWDGAFVYCREGIKTVLVYFEDGKDFINDGSVTIKDGTRDYNNLISKGWLPMTNEDLMKTSGVRIDEHTNTNIPTEDEEELNIPLKRIIPNISSNEMKAKTHDFFETLKTENSAFANTLSDLIETLKNSGELDNLKEHMENGIENIPICKLMSLGNKLIGSLNEEGITALMNFSQQLVPKPNHPTTDNLSILVDSIDRMLEQNTEPAIINEQNDDNINDFISTNDLLDKNKSE